MNPSDVSRRRINILVERAVRALHGDGFPAGYPAYLLFSEDGQEFDGVRRTRPTPLTDRYDRGLAFQLKSVTTGGLPPRTKYQLRPMGKPGRNDVGRLTNDIKDELQRFSADFDPRESKWDEFYRDTMGRRRTRGF